MSVRLLRSEVYQWYSIALLLFSPDWIQNEAEQKESRVKLLHHDYSNRTDIIISKREELAPNSRAPWKSTHILNR